MTLREFISKAVAEWYLHSKTHKESLSEAVVDAIPRCKTCEYYYACYLEDEDKSVKGDGFCDEHSAYQEDCE